MPPKPKDPEEIAEDFPYLQELMQAIAAVRHAIDAGKDGRDAAENLLAEIPDDWTEEIQDRITEERRIYNLSLKGSPSQRYFAGKHYSRRIVKIAISLFKKKDMLFKTRKPIERGSLSIWNKSEDIDE